MHRWKLVGSIAALAAAGFVGSALPGFGADSKKPVDSNIGFVDLGRVTDQIKRTPIWQTMTQKYEDQAKKAQQDIADLTKIRYLTEAERKELETLRAKPKPTDAENARINALQAQSDLLDQEFQKLAGVEKPTPEQDARMKALAKLRENAVNALQEAAEKRSQALQKLEGEVLEEMQGKILKVVGDIADNRKLSMVIDRQAILYGGQDLTEDVLKKLK